MRLVTSRSALVVVRDRRGADVVLEVGVDRVREIELERLGRLGDTVADHRNLEHDPSAVGFEREGSGRRHVVRTGGRGTVPGRVGDGHGSATLRREGHDEPCVLRAAVPFSHAGVGDVDGWSRAGTDGRHTERPHAGLRGEHRELQLPVSEAETAGHARIW